MVKFISVLVMLFSILISTVSYAEIIDRVVAYVDNQAITLNDFEKFATEMRKKVPEIKNEEIVNLIINRILLLKKAKELFFEGKAEELINNYIELVIKSRIIIPDSKIREYYEKNKSILGNKPYLSVRDEIERYLFEKELNLKLKEHIEELKKTSEIKIIVIPSDNK